MNFLNESKVLKNWGSLITESTGINDPAKVLWMSQMCEIQSQNAALNEANLGYTHLNPAMNINGMGAMAFPQMGATAGTAGIAGDGSGDIPTQTLSIAIQIAAQTIALDLVPVVPMNAPFGVINYWDTVYGGGRVEGDGPFTGTAATNATSPLLVKLVGGSQYSTTITAIKAAQTGEDPSVYSFTAGDYTLTYVKDGFIDGKPIFVVTGKNNDSDTDIENEFYPTVFGGQSLAQAGGTDYEFGLVNAKEDHVTLFSGKGAFEGAKVNDNPYDTNYSLNPYEREEGENTPLNVLNAKFTSKDVKAKTYQAAYALTWEQVQDAGKTGVGDIVALAEAALINELTQSINKLILSQMWELGSQFAAANGLSADLDVTLDNTNTLNGGETKAIKARDILSRILYASNLIAQKGRRGSASFVVCSPEVATAIQTVTTTGAWVAANTIDTKGDLYPIGSIAGMTVYVDPNLNSGNGTVIVGRKNKADEPGLVFCPYLMADKVEVVPESTMGYKIGMKSRFALVATGQHPETNYCKFNVKGALTLI